MKNNYLLQGYIVLNPNIKKDREFFPQDKSKWFEQDLLDAAHDIKSFSTGNEAIHIISVYVDLVEDSIEKLDKITSSYVLFYQSTDDRFSKNATLVIKSYGQIKDSVSNLNKLGIIPGSFSFDFRKVSDYGKFRYEKYINRENWYVGDCPVSEIESNSDNKSLDVFYVPDELDTKTDKKYFVLAILGVGVILFIGYWLFSYVGEFKIVEHLGAYAIVWMFISLFLLARFLEDQDALKPEVILELIKDCADTPKLKDTILNIIRVQKKLSKRDLNKILFAMQKERSALYISNVRNLVGTEKDQESEILAKGEAEVEIYTKSIDVLGKTIDRLET